MPLIKARLLDTALSSYESFSSGRSPSEDLTVSEVRALSHLSKNKNIAIQKADKGYTIVILDKAFNISATEKIIIDHKKFSKIDIPTDKEINYISNLEKRITSDPKLLKNEKIIDRATYKNIKPIASRPDVL